LPPISHDLEDFNLADSPPKEHKGIGSASSTLGLQARKSIREGTIADDEEEGESLWRRKRSDEESEIALEETLKGIRLVTPIGEVKF